MNNFDKKKLQNLGTFIKMSPGNAHFIKPNQIQCICILDIGKAL